MIDLTSRRLVIAYNPASTRAPEVKSRVFDRLATANISYEVIEVQVTSPEININNIAQLIQPGDIILSAAGDGSAHAVMNAVIVADQSDVQLGFLAFGNFNDLPRSLNDHKCWKDPVALLHSATIRQVYPLQVQADKQFKRWTLMYATMGWTATAAAQYDRPEVRSRLQRPGQAFMLTNLSRLARYYFRSRSSYYLPLLGEERPVTDIMAVNGPITARFFKSRHSLTNDRQFLVKRLNVSQLLRNFKFLFLSAIGRLPAETKESLELSFQTPNEFMLQLDGEVVVLENVASVSVTKAIKPLNVLASKTKI